jgi:hypothetical protein
MASLVDGVAKSPTTSKLTGMSFGLTGERHLTLKTEKFSET